MTISDRIHCEAVVEFLENETVIFELYAEFYNIEATRESFDDRYQRNEGIVTFGHHAEKLDINSDIAQNTAFISNFEPYDLEGFRFTSDASINSDDISDVQYIQKSIEFLGTRSIFVYDDWGMQDVEAEDSLFSTACSGDEIYAVKSEEVD